MSNTEIQEFETDKGKFILQRLPDNVDKDKIWNEDHRLNCVQYYLQGEMYYDRIWYETNVEIIGLISDLTEEQCFELVGKSNYKLAKDCFENFCNCFGVDFKENWLLIKLI